MSEKIYAWLLRLYPSRFRQEYGEAAMQLFRDRSRHERGLLSALRLWLDLLTDLAFSVPLQYGRGEPAPVTVTALRQPDGMPSFHVIEGQSPRPGALLLGCVLSLAAIGASIPASRLDGSGTFQVAASGGSAQAGNERGGAISASRSSAPGVMEPRKVVDAAIANLKEHYVDPEAAKKMADALVAHEKAGGYDAITDGAALAALLTRQLRDVSHDLNLDVIYSQSVLPIGPRGPSPEGLTRYKAAMERQNCTFEKVEILPHNVGYLKLNSFPDPSICGTAAKAAMASLNRVNAIIFDLRDNTGGYPEMVMLLAAYLFDHPEYMYNPRENTTERSWTRSPVPGSNLTDKPVYLLTSARTASGAENFSYDLKMLKRATLIGETTAGAAHSGVFRRLDDHFGMGIPEVRAINPFSSADWAVTGVEPDVKLKASDALVAAQKLSFRAARVSKR